MSESKLNNPRFLTHTRKLEEQNYPGILAYTQIFLIIF